MNGVAHRVNYYITNRLIIRRNDSIQAICAYHVGGARLAAWAGPGKAGVITSGVISVAQEVTLQG